MHGEFVAIFDCDHVPVRSFLQMTVGWLVRDPKIALVQTPHHFYSQDPFERNLGLSSAVPVETRFFMTLFRKQRHLERHDVLRLLRRHSPQRAR